MPSKAFRGVFVPNGPQFCGYRTPDCGEIGEWDCGKIFLKTITRAFLKCYNIIAVFRPRLNDIVISNIITEKFNFKKMEKVTLKEYVAPDFWCTQIQVSNGFAQSQPMNSNSSGKYSLATGEEAWW